ncbi:hypothetical protein VTK26DRAFT_2741 [Humicola hyalothermophila]
MSAPPPKQDINWSGLDLSKPFPVNGHVEVRHHLATDTWTAPTLVEGDQVSISGLSPGLNYGQQCYEGLKAFRQASTSGRSIAIFRPHFHHARLCTSAAAVCLPAPPLELFLECLNLAVAHNAAFVPPHDTDLPAYLYIRPVLFGASSRVTLAPPDEVVLAVYVLPAVPYHGTAALDGVVLDDFDRAAPRGTGKYKVGGNYAPVWRHAAKAREMGFGITLHLDSATREWVEEFSTSGFLGHYIEGEEKKGKEGEGGEATNVLLVPETDSAIASATSDSIVQIASRSAGWRVEKRPVRFSELGRLDEVVAVGTAAAAVPVRSLSRLGTGEKYTFPRSENGPGPIAELARRMVDIQRGRAEDTDGWLYEVKGYPPQEEA